MNLTTPTCLWDVGAELGEGPVWDEVNRRLYFVDIKGRKIHSCAEDGSQRRSWNTPRQTGFVLPAAEGDFVCGMQDGLYRFAPESGAFSLLGEVEPALPGNRLNDGYIDAHGRLWFGSMDDGESLPSGSLYSIEAGAAAVAHDPGYIITNGPATSPDGATFYHTDTLERVVYAFDVGADGTLSGKRLFVACTGSGHPDGSAVDADGCVWVAMFGGARIDRYTKEGQLIQTLDFPCSNITKLTFGGADLRTMFVTTAWKGLSPEQRAGQPLAGSLFTLRSPTPGLAQHRFGARRTA